MPPLSDEFLKLAELAIKGNHEAVRTYLRRIASKYRETESSFADQLTGLMRARGLRSNDSVIREMDSGQPDVVLPVDADSRLSLVRIEDPPVFEMEPIYGPEIQGALDRLVKERLSEVELIKHGLMPTRSALFVGSPGVGKTLAARWLARELKRPLLTLDLAAVMSSFLGRTGNNVRTVLDFARSVECVLLLDEFDAIAKRRDDYTEIGELKRLVTVLLQEIDSWPAHGLLLAATNHAELLDRAIWRRFDVVLEFGLPNVELALEAVTQHFPQGTAVSNQWKAVLATVFDERPFSEISQFSTRVRRVSTLDNLPLEEVIRAQLKRYVVGLDKSKRIHIAVMLRNEDVLSERDVRELTDLSRDTIRKHAKQDAM